MYLSLKFFTLASYIMSETTLTENQKDMTIYNNTFNQHSCKILYTTKIALVSLNKATI